MATNLAIDPELLERALAVGSETTEKATVAKALEEFIARRDQTKILELGGKFDDWEPDHDYEDRCRGRERKLGLTD